jgi:hypothetical protein
VERLTHDLWFCSDKKIRGHAIRDLYRAAWGSFELERQISRSK